jgi:anti-anti-sigma factor
VGIRERRSGTELIVALSGELDAAASDLGTRLGSLPTDDPALELVTVDMAGVRFLDSSAISALIEMRRRMEALGLGFRMVNVLETQHQAFDIVGVLDLLGVQELSEPDQRTEG